MMRRVVMFRVGERVLGGAGRVSRLRGGIVLGRSGGGKKVKRVGG